MNYRIIQRVLGLLLVVFSGTNFPPLLVSFIYKDGAHAGFIDAFWITAILGLILWFPVRRQRGDLSLREGFFTVVMFWVVLGVFGALPLYVSELDITVTDAIFESISGLTTTGATVITGLDDLPKSILFYRQELQWLGGMGIIVLAVAILPMLGIGGMQLYRAETPGPIKDSKLTPRINETAKALWLIYVALTALCALCYWLAGMTVFDAIAHSFSTVAIGGFSPHDASIGYFDSALIEAIAILFMVLGGVNFGLHFAAVRSRTLTPYAKDEEFKTYIGILVGISALSIAGLLFTHTVTEPGSAIRKGIFHVVSISTTTGFATDSFHLWPAHLGVLLIMSSFVGGSAGSTGGGMKVIRILLFFKQGMREMKRIIHPNAHFVVKVGGFSLSDKVVQSVWGFFSTYMAICVFSVLLLMVLGLDQVTAFSAAVACLNNLGPGLGEVGPNFSTISDPSKWWLCFLMLLGRLEVFTLLVLFTPVFWRR